MNIEETYLITKDARGKFRGITLTLEEIDPNVEYAIHRITGMFGGKTTQQPSINITEGKASRTVLEQSNLKYKSMLKKYMDKGYKKIEKDFRECTEDYLEFFIPLQEKTDSTGKIKPMLAKRFENVPMSYNNKIDSWYVSRKLDGVRCMIQIDSETKNIVTSSRGGTNYDASLVHIINHPTIQHIFKLYPNIVLDGEIYTHGMTLQQISGLARRSEENLEECSKLQFWIFDYINLDNPNEPFSERMHFLAELNSYFLIPFDIDDKEENESFPLRVVTHQKMFVYDRIMTLHNKFVSEGFEGAVARTSDSPYEIGKRPNSMQKFKQYQDAEALVIGKEGGLRDWEDMVFIMQLEDGKTFKAKPVGTREIRKEYWDNFDNKYKNKIGTYKFFTVSEDGIPTQPAFKCFRDYE